MTSTPLILTLTLDPPAQEYFDALRDEHFPKHCNYLKAHLTLFHHLPSDDELIGKTVEKFCSRPAMILGVSAIKNIGNGVAYEILSDELLQLHHRLQREFDPHLISQDRKKLWPHITVQNKVTAFKAKQTAGKLQGNFMSFNITATGIRSWLYRGGPWEAKGEWKFRL
ncbi:2'-5' RNA ligase family protein [Ferruginibacter sp. HRS2-29]|uniref:2'-5' RNA ligase family protein n=1 Tax=Ferruginibacter sp. HRS2-29 TaxID=2487334 RepID=UPI0020CC2DDD|nr:2'-5' RNA ligase family protein [Ferruginibacter sp. HRS2-29]MCP9752421.1 2'-5' RNA ligase family protein [Ferruginibacter sp. HRS2-29]